MTEHLKAENARLNDELTYAGEAHQSLTTDNERMREALEAAAKVFRDAGDDEMAERMNFGLTGERPAPKGFKLPSSRKVA